MQKRSVEKTGLHPRNKHRGRYDFSQLIAAHSDLAAFVTLNAYQTESIDFSNPLAVKALNCALLKRSYGITWWDIPPQYLCPPIPGRADYLHHLADLLAADNGGIIPVGKFIRAMDIGVGANCIYPLIGHSQYGWNFVGTDIDATALACAQTILDANDGYREAIMLRLQSSATAVFDGVLGSDEYVALTLCNPPFHASLREADAGTRRKWKNLGKAGAKRPGLAHDSPALNFGGQSNELWCEGGEEGFICRMIAESIGSGNHCLWFSTLVSKSTTLPGIYRALKKAGVCDSRTIEMAQGQKSSRLVAWTFLNQEQRQSWLLKAPA